MRSTTQCGTSWRRSSGCAEQVEGVSEMCVCDVHVHVLRVRALPCQARRRVADVVGGGVHHAFKRAVLCAKGGSGAKRRPCCAVQALVSTLTLMVVP